MGDLGKTREEFPNEQLLVLEVTELPWYANIVNYLFRGLLPPGATSHQRKKLIHDARFYIWDESYLFTQ